MLQAIIFDFDGVICDTEPLHYRAFVRALAGLSITFSEEDYFTRYVGLNDRAAIVAIGRDAQQTLADDVLDSVLHVKNEAYFAKIASGIDRLPGVDRLIPRLARRWPLAICSGARRTEIETILRHAGLMDYFRLVVSANEVRTSKPDPAGYLETLRALRRFVPELAARQCLVIEDTPLGIAAARAAGMKTLGVQSRLTAHQLAAADAIVPSLRSISSDGLAAIFDGDDQPIGSSWRAGDTAATDFAPPPRSDDADAGPWLIS